MTSLYRTCSAAAVLLVLGLLPFTAQAEDKNIEIMDLDSILAKNSLPAGGPPAKVVAATRAGNSELQVLVMSKIRMHHHDEEDHIVYIARGNGTARLQNASGQVETRQVQPGDIFNLPRGRKHAFQKTGSDDIVMLVVATAGWKPLEDTKFHE